MLVARTRRGDLEVEGLGPLLDLLAAAGVPVGCSCSAAGACGRCVVTVLEGLALLSPPDDHERRVLARTGAGPDARLACRAELVGVGTVRVTTGYW